MSSTMKTSKPVPTDSLSNRRAQPVRQTRNNPPRPFHHGAQPLGRDVGNGLGRGQSPPLHSEIFPAITHFTDAITALPKELVRHFTLLKEVDAKIFGPEETLGHMVDAALNSTPPEPKPIAEGFLGTAPASAQFGTSAPDSINGSIINGRPGSVASAIDPMAAFEPDNLPRRQHFGQCAMTMQEMLVALDEKNHVISTAVEALNRGLARLDGCFPYIEREISDEARLGNPNHWAYIDNRPPHNGEKSRKEPASVILAAAQQADETAARSEARRLAVLAKKSSRNHHAGSDFEDQKGESGKRVHGNSKIRRNPEAQSVGLGITNSTNGNPPKRRKVPAPANGSTAMERSASAVTGSSAANAKGKAGSPRETPIPEPKKRPGRTAIPAPPGRKRTNTVNSIAQSPSLASSPVHSTFADAKLARGSPAPAVRPPTSRGRQNSTQSIVDSARQRPSSATSNKPNGNGTGGAPDLNAVAGVTGRSVSEVKSTMKESASNSKGEHMIEDTDQEHPDMRGAVVVGSRKDSALKREDSVVNGETTPIVPVTTKSGRASKPSTPAIPSFPEPAPRSRSSRNTLDSSGKEKRSHKKGHGQAEQQRQQAAAQRNYDDGRDEMQLDMEADEDQAEDDDEPRYCYCNGVSYGEMVACDGEGCIKEWFHLECAGLKVAPKGNAKWYCTECKGSAKNSHRFNGR